MCNWTNKKLIIFVKRAHKYVVYDLPVLNKTEKNDSISRSKFEMWIIKLTFRKATITITKNSSNMIKLMKRRWIEIRRLGCPDKLVLTHNGCRYWCSLANSHHYNRLLFAIMGQFECKLCLNKSILWQIYIYITLHLLESYVFTTFDNF